MLEIPLLCKFISKELLAWINATSMHIFNLNTKNEIYSAPFTFENEIPCWLSSTENIEIILMNNGKLSYFNKVFYKTARTLKTIYLLPENSDQ